MIKLVECSNKGFIFKLLEMKLNKKLIHFKEEKFFILTKDNIVLGIKRISHISNVERRFISLKDYSFIQDNNKNYLYNMWVSNECTDMDIEKLKIVIPHTTSKEASIP